MNWPTLIPGFQCHDIEMWMWEVTAIDLWAFRTQNHIKSKLRCKMCCSGHCTDHIQTGWFVFVSFVCFCFPSARHWTVCCLLWWTWQGFTPPPLWSTYVESALPQFVLGAVLHVKLLQAVPWDGQPRTLSVILSTKEAFFFFFKLDWNQIDMFVRCLVKRRLGERAAASAVVSHRRPRCPGFNRALVHTPNRFCVYQ